ncbi:MAG: hypothetical protein QW680_09350 [Pyrobaculum sp.]
MVFKTLGIRRSTYVSEVPDFTAVSQYRQIAGFIDLLPYYAAKLFQCSGGAYYDAMTQTLYFPPGSECRIRIRGESNSEYINFRLLFSQVDGVLKWHIRDDPFGVVDISGAFRNDNRYTRYLVFTFSPRGFTLRLYNDGATAISASLALLFLWSLPLFHGLSYASYALPLPSFTSFVLSTYFTTVVNATHNVSTIFRSRDGAIASVTLNESGRTLATFTTTSTTYSIPHVSRFFERRNAVTYSWSLSPNAELLSFYVDTFLMQRFTPSTKSISQTFTTTSTTRTTGALLSLSTTYAKLRRIAVIASSNAGWLVKVGGNVVLDSAWGITSIDFSPPIDTMNVDVDYWSRDGTAATVTVIAVYDEYPGRL